MSLPTGIREDITSLQPYVAGASIETMAAELGMAPSEIVKLASNESPLPPFPEVVEVVAAAATSLNRYPDNTATDLRAALSDRLSLTPDHVWVGAGSSELLRVIALATGGPTSSAVYPWPSFVIYPLATTVAMAKHIRVPLTANHTIDIHGMLDAVRPDTTVLYICNPNNPTGSHVSLQQLRLFVSSIDRDVLVVVDEAYAEFATANDFGSAVGLVDEFTNLVVTRTFSKVYGLAGLRVAYAVGAPGTLSAIARAQAPFTINRLATMAALEALKYPGRVEERIRATSELREALEREVRERGMEFVASQANFVYLRIPSSVADPSEQLAGKGVLVRGFPNNWIRVTVGDKRELQRFIEVLDGLLSTASGSNG